MDMVEQSSEESLGVPTRLDMFPSSFHVPADTETTAGTCEQDHTHARFLGASLEVANQLLDHRDVESVEHLWSVKGDRRNALIHSHHHLFIGNFF